MTSGVDGCASLKHKMSALIVPSVTEADLLAFHHKHFGPHVDNAPFPEPSMIEDDDGLGWYPDGVKRTLTDEQVQIFRHSELQRLLLQLEQQHRTDKDDESTPNPAAEVSRLQPDKSTPVKSNKNKRKNQRRRKQRDAAAATTAAAALATQTATEKRKWGQYVQDHEQNPNRLTHRRLARELDAQKFESTELSYDD